MYAVQNDIFISDLKTFHWFIDVTVQETNTIESDEYLKGLGYLICSKHKKQALPGLVWFLFW